MTDWQTLTNTTHWRFTWRDRLRVLFTGRYEFKVELQVYSPITSALMLRVDPGPTWVAYPGPDPFDE